MQCEKNPLRNEEGVDIYCEKLKVPRNSCKWRSSKFRLRGALCNAPGSYYMDYENNPLKNVAEEDFLVNIPKKFNYDTYDIDNRNILCPFLSTPQVLIGEGQAGPQAIDSRP